MKRRWDDAVEAHEGHGCLVCGRFPRDLAHTIGRKYDRLPGQKAKVVRVDPLAVVPLCAQWSTAEPWRIVPPRHHELYDEHRLDLFPYLTVEEIGHAVARLGEGQAMRRIRGRAWLEDAA